MVYTSLGYMLLGFFAFLHSGEFTVQSTQVFDHLTPRDIVLHSLEQLTLMKTHLKESKNRPDKTRIDLFIGKTGLPCQQSYIAMRGQDDGPLFILQDVWFLILIRRLQAALMSGGIDYNRYYGHSFCISTVTIRQ